MKEQIFEKSFRFKFAELLKQFESFASGFVDTLESVSRPTDLMVLLMGCSCLSFNDNTSSSCSLIRLRVWFSSFFDTSISNTDDSVLLPPKFRNLSLMISREHEFDMSLPFASTSRKDTDFLRVSEETGFFSNEISLAFARLPVEWLPKTSPVDWFGAKD